MSKKNLLSGREKELQDMADSYEQAKAEQRSIYLDAEDLADLADWYSVRQKRDTAMEVVNYGLRLHPDNTSLLIEKAYLFLDDYDTYSAGRIAERLDASLTETKVLQAQIYILDDKEDEATRLLDTISNKKDIDVMISVAYMYINVNKPGMALAWLSPGIGRYEDDEPFLSVLGDAYYGRGMLEDAERVFNKLIDKNPYSAAYWFGLARCYFDEQKYDKAIDACDYAIVSDEEFSDAYLMKGHSFFYLQNEEKALESFREAERLGAVSKCFIDTFIGLNKSAQEEWESAYRHLSRAIECYEDDDLVNLSILYANVAFCLWQMGKEEESMRYWEKAHDYDPENADIYLLESRMYLEKNEYDKACGCWKRALCYVPYASTWHEIGLSCLEHGYIEQAKSAFETVKKLEPDFLDINEKLATVYLLLKDKANFQKYNQLCKHPITVEDVQQIQELLKKENKESLMLAMKNILNALK